MGSMKYLLFFACGLTLMACHSGGSGSANAPIMKADLPQAACSALTPLPNPKFVSIQTIFPETNEILTAKDTSKNLFKLKSIASPTEDYYNELYRLVLGVSYVDVDHLLMIARASYFNAADYQHLEEDLKLTSGKFDEVSCARQATIQRDMPLAQNLSLITDRMISVGLTKIRDLTYEDALLVLQELLPAGSPSSSFRIVADRFKPLSEARNLELMTLADQKHAFEAASDLALFWFDTYSDKSLKSLAKVAQQINGHGRDLFLAAGALTFPQLKVDEVKSLVQLAVTDTGSVGAAAMTKVSEIDSRDIIDVYTPMDDANRGDFLVKVVPLYKTIQPSEIKTFLRATLHRRGEIAKLAAPNIDGIRYDSVIEIAGLIEDAAKDDVLYILIPKVGALNIDQVIQLMDAAHVGQFNVVKLARPSLVDLNVSGIITIAMKLAGSNRDEWIISAIPALGETSPEDLQVLMKTSSQGALQISQILLPKIKAILTTQIAAIAELLTGAEKDVWILSVIPKLEKLYAEGLLKIIHASYAKGYEVAMALIPKLQEFEVSEALQLAKEFSGPSRDEILLAEIPKIKEIKAENVAELVAMAYQRQSDIKLLAQSQVHTAP